MQYPSGNVVTYGFDSAGRVNSVTGPSNKNYANMFSLFSYWAHGAVHRMTLGTSVTETTAYETLLGTGHC